MALHSPDARKMTYANQNREFTGDVWDEVGFALDKNWGLVGAGGGWKEVVACDTMLDVIARISNLVFVGFPSCRFYPYLLIEDQLIVW